MNQFNQTRISKLLESVIVDENKKTTCRFCEYEYPTSSHNRNDKWSRHVRGRNCIPKHSHLIIERGLFLDELVHVIKDCEKMKQPIPSTSISSNHISPNISIIQDSSPSKILKSSKSNDEILSEFLDSFALLMFTTGTPLSFIENPLLLKSLQILCPWIKLPCRKTLTEKHLDKIYKEQKMKTEEQLSHKYSEKSGIQGTLQCDAWTNNVHESVLSFVYSSPALPKPLYLESVFPSFVSLNSNFVANEFTRVINKIGNEKVIAIVTDNESTMSNARDIVRGNFPSLKNPGCLCHWLALIPKDLESNSATVRDTFTKASTVVKYLTNHHAPHALFMTHSKGKSLKMPVATRWFTNLMMIESLDECMGALSACVHDQRFLSKSVMVNGEVIRSDLTNDQLNEAKKIKDIVMNGNIWDRVKFLKNILAPLRDAEKKFESAYPPIQDVYPTLIEYKLFVDKFVVSDWQNSIKQKLKNILDARFQFLKSERMYVQAHLLDPSNLGAKIGADPSFGHNISSVQSDMSSEFVTEAESVGFQTELAKYMINMKQVTDGYKKAQKSHNLVHFFYTISQDYPLLSPFAIRLFSIVPTTASVERHFSSFGFIHRKLRNRLTQVNATKLVFIFQNYHAENRVENEDESSDDEDFSPTNASSSGDSSDSFFVDEV